MFRDYAKYIVSLVVFIVLVFLVSIAFGDTVNTPCGNGKIREWTAEYNDYFITKEYCNACDYEKVISSISKYKRNRNIMTMILIPTLLILGFLTYFFMKKAYKQASMFILVILLGVSSMGCGEDTPKDTSMGLHRLQESWDMKRYHINREYQESKEHASKVYAAWVFKVYSDTEDLQYSKSIASQKYSEYKSKAWNTYQVRLMGLNGIKFNHWNMVYTLTHSDRQ